MIDRDDMAFALGIVIIICLFGVLFFMSNVNDTQKKLVVEFEALHRHLSKDKQELRDMYEAMCDIEEAQWIELPEDYQKKPSSTSIALSPEHTNLPSWMQCLTCERKKGIS